MKQGWSRIWYLDLGQHHVETGAVPVVHTAARVPATPLPVLRRRLRRSRLSRAAPDQYSRPRRWWCTSVEMPSEAPCNGSMPVDASSSHELHVILYPKSDRYGTAVCPVPKSRHWCHLGPRAVPVVVKIEHGSIPMSYSTPRCSANVYSCEKGI